jgi:C4-dicarboxylate-specific signal transduction histidine kinase
MDSELVSSQRPNPNPVEESAESARVDSQVVELDRLLTRGEMAGEIAHEMNNDLTILMGNIELFPLLLANGNHSAIANKLPLMKETLEKIAGYAQSLLSYGKTQEQLDLVDLRRIVTDAVSFLKPQNRFDNIRICTDLSSDISPVRGDAGQLQQVVVNLLNNAADELNECRKPEPLIQVRTVLSKDGRSSVLSVSDNGRGIPESARPMLFTERFTTRENGEGFGLLACRIIAERHGGEIKFETTSGLGTTFELHIPIVRHVPVRSRAASDGLGR